tara:strand:+ start:218 stop:367 length:150 start_codon:yes stop_codon:yes gene_type:complete
MATCYGSTEAARVEVGGVVLLLEAELAHALLSRVRVRVRGRVRVTPMRS